MSIIKKLNRRSMKSHLTIGASSSKHVRFGGSVTEILEEYEKGYEDNYRLFLCQLKDPLIKSSQLVEWYQQCSRVARILDKKQNELVNALLKVRWMEKEAAVVSAYQGFIIALVSSNTVHLRPVLKALTCCFLPDLKKKDSLTSMIGLEDKQLYETTHALLKSVLNLIPQSTSVVTEVFIRNFPYMLKDASILEWYVKNLIYVTTYAPQLRCDILEVIIRRMADIDVNTPRKVIQESEESDDEEEILEDSAVFTMDEDMKSFSEGMKHPLAERLDILMLTLLQYTKDYCYVEGQFSFRDGKQLFGEFLRIFDIVILPLHELVHVQFTLFYICSFRKTFYLAFIQHCWEKFCDPSVAAIIRQGAICYVASLVARAKYITLQTATTCLDTMTSWAHRYVKETTESGSFDVVSCDISRHSTFYSACQAIFYVVVFRHKEILETKKGHHYLMSLNLQHLVTSHLNPLRACLSSVVALFSSTMRIHQIVYCDTIVERNNRLMLPVVGSTSSALATPNPLESFFPFDPFLLKRSSSFVDPLYQEWEGRVPHNTVDENMNEETPDERLMATDDQLLTCESLNSAAGSLSKSNPLAPGFSMMSASPF